MPLRPCTGLDPISSPRRQAHTRGPASRATPAVEVMTRELSHRSIDPAATLGSPAMIEAFLWGAVAASPLLVGALVAYVTTPSKHLIAVVLALGSGLLIGSVAFELIDEALKTTDVAKVGLFTLVGAATFTVGNRVLDKQGGGDRKDSEGAQENGSPLAIVFGSVLDGIPESFVLGLTVLQGGVSVALLIGIVLSNLPEGLSSSSGLRIAGWARSRVVRMWLIVILVSAVSAALGFALLDPASGRTGALAQGFAAGALLAMITDTMLPEAYDVERVSTGSLVAIGFAVSLMLSAI